MNYLRYFVLATIAIYTMVSCEVLDDNDNEKDSLYVKFIKEQALLYYHNPTNQKQVPG